MATKKKKTMKKQKTIKYPKFLNPPGSTFQSTSAICVSDCYLSLSDCSRKIYLEFDLYFSSRHNKRALDKIYNLRLAKIELIREALDVLEKNLNHSYGECLKGLEKKKNTRRVKKEI